MTLSRYLLALALAVMVLSGCGKDENVYGTVAWDRKNPTYAVNNCIKSHLDTMSQSDHVQKWDAELYKEVCKECEKLFLQP